jgi:hypothetical protein
LADSGDSTECRERPLKLGDGGGVEKSFTSRTINRVQNVPAAAKPERGAGQAAGLYSELAFLSWVAHSPAGAAPTKQPAYTSTMSSI